jgi:hypothetical protein
MPSSSSWGQPLAKKAIEKITTPKALRARPWSVLRQTVADVQLCLIEPDADAEGGQGIVERAGNVRLVLAGVKDICRPRSARSDVRMR